MNSDTFKQRINFFQGGNSQENHIIDKRKKIDKIERVEKKEKTEKAEKSEKNEKIEK